MKNKDRKKLLVKLLKEGKISEEEFYLLLEEENEKENKKIIKHNDGYYEI